MLLLLACAAPSGLPAQPPPAFHLAPPPRPAGFRPVPGGVVADTSTGVHARFTSSGVHLGHDLKVRTTAIGRGSNPSPLQLPAPISTTCAGAPCAKLDAGDVAESWVEHDGGFEQRWTIGARPAGAGPLVVDIAVTGGALVATGAGATLDGPSGEAWTIGDVRAWDAAGVALPTQLSVTAGAVRLAVTDSGARYPVTVDPTYRVREADYVVGGTAFTVLGDIDVNGDGYPDLFMSEQGPEGVAYPWLGTADGFKAEALTYYHGLEHYGMDRLPIGAADVNGDGYDDVFAVADEAEAVFGYAGSPAGPRFHSWTFSEHATANYDGLSPAASVAGAGDVNLDGYEDLLIGVPAFAEEPGRVTIHLGSADGPRDDDSTQELHATNPGGILDLFGFSVGAAGDVNGDGWPDILAGGNTGFTQVFYGSEAGFSDTATTTLETSGTTWSVAGVGDVNGDGYDDVMAGMPSEDYPDWGYIYGYAALFLGGAGGVDPTPAWTRSGRDLLRGGLYGYSVAGAGDIDGDGYADVVTGDYDQPEVFLGTPDGGLDAEPLATMTEGGAASVSSAGDVDRDGRGDVVVTTGRVYLAATLLTPPGDGDDDSEPGDSAVPDTGGGEKGGCDGSGGCDAVGAPGTFTGMCMVVVATLQRRVDRRTP